jgi:hypothetical protein
MWYVIAVVVCLVPVRPSQGSDLPEEVQKDVRRIYSLGERFDRARIDSTCAEVVQEVSQDAEDSVDKTPFRCFRTAFKRAVREKEPSVSGYVLLLSIGTVVLAEERQKILESRLNESELEKALQANSLDTAELLIETLERVAAKSRVIEQEVPVAEKLRKTLRNRAESILRPRASGRSPASSSVSIERGRRDALLARLSDIDSE